MLLPAHIAARCLNVDSALIYMLPYSLAKKRPRAHNLQHLHYIPMMARFMHIIAIMTSCNPHCTLPLHTSIAHFHCTLPLHTSIAHFHCTLPLHTSIAHVHCTLPLASFPGHSQILSRSRGSGLGTKLHFHCTSGVAKDPANARLQHEHSTFVRILAQNVETNLGGLGRYSPENEFLSFLGSFYGYFSGVASRLATAIFVAMVTLILYDNS